MDDHRYFWDDLAGVAAGPVPGSTGWQIDGEAFSEGLYTCWLSQTDALAT